jgi:hypothetical protein
MAERPQATITALFMSELSAPPGQYLGKRR